MVSRPPAPPLAPWIGQSLVWKWKGARIFLLHVQISLVKFENNTKMINTSDHCNYPGASGGGRPREEGSNRSQSASLSRTIMRIVEVNTVLVIVLCGTPLCQAFLAPAPVTTGRCNSPLSALSKVTERRMAGISPSPIMMGQKDSSDGDLSSLAARLQVVPWSPRE